MIYLNFQMRMLMKQNQIREEKELRYEVTYGPKKESDREVKSFDDENKALEFFEKKDKEGFHVDAYEIETTVKKKKLSR